MRPGFSINSPFNDIQTPEQKARVMEAVDEGGMKDNPAVVISLDAVAHKIPVVSDPDFAPFCCKWELLPVVDFQSKLKAYCLTTQQYIGDATRLIEVMGIPVMYWNEYDLAQHKENGMVIREHDE